MPDSCSRSKRQDHGSKSHMFRGVDYATDKEEVVASL